MSLQMQARSSTNGQLYNWVAVSPDFAGTGFPGPGTALDTAISMRPAVTGTGGGTDHNTLSNLTTGDSHTQYELAQRPLSAYTAASNDLVLADARKCITSNRATAISLRIRLQASVAWVAETLLGGINLGAGTLTITAEGGVTLNGSVTVPQHGWWWAKRTVSNVWQVFTGGVGGVGDFKADGTVAMTADLNHGGFKGTNAAAAVAGTDLTILSQVQALIAAGISTIFDVKPSVRLVTAAALPASTRVGNVRTANANGALPNIDGVAPALNDRIGDTQHATGEDRGLWTVTNLGSGGTPWVLTRATDADTDAEVTPGLAFIPEEGTQKGHIFILTTAAPFVVNTSSWTFSDVQAVAGDGSTIQLIAGVLSLITGGIATTHLGNDQVTFAKLLNATAADKVIGSDAGGDFKELTLTGGVERSGTNIQVSTTLPARGTKNTATDLAPPQQAGGTIATANSITLDVPITAGKWAIVTFSVRCHASNVVKYLKTLQVYAQNVAGTVTIDHAPTLAEVQLEGAVWTLQATVSTTNVRATLTNNSGSTRTYSIVGGKIEVDL